MQEAMAYERRSNVGSTFTAAFELQQSKLQRQLTLRHRSEKEKTIYDRERHRESETVAAAADFLFCLDRINMARRI